MKEWLKRWLARREANKPVSWDKCAWSPKKAAEKRFIEMWTKQRMRIVKIQMDAAMAQLEEEIRRARGKATNRE